MIHHRWPGWVARALKEPLAERILKVVREAEGRYSLAELPGRLNGVEPEARSGRSWTNWSPTWHWSRTWSPKRGTWWSGSSPPFAQDLIRASQPRDRPPLLVCERPKEVGPDGSVIVNDLRAVLLEIASEPPRLRQDQSLFHKESERFQAILEPLPAWWLQSSEMVRRRADEPGRRLGPRSLQLVKEVSEGKQTRAPSHFQGTPWLSSGLEEQYDEDLQPLRSSAGQSDMYFAAPERVLVRGDAFSRPRNLAISASSESTSRS